MTVSGVSEKVQKNMLGQFFGVRSKWEETIRSSFLSADMQDRYLSLLDARFKVITSRL
jgi:hypothetical protein